MRIRCLAPNFLRQTRRSFSTIKTEEADFAEVAKEVSRITRTRPRWEQTLRTDYPSFDFSNPRFFGELLKHQNNAFFSFRFFLWLKNCDFEFSPDLLSCNALFNALVEANACTAAKDFLEITGFSPEYDSLECYIRCLFKSGFVEHAIGVFGELRRGGFCPSPETWNSALLGCLRVKRNDLFWGFYKEMTESGVGVDVKTVGFLIQAFCNENQVFRGYELLRQVLEDGSLPVGNASFNTLLCGFIKDRDYGRVSELLHMMIETKCDPDIHTYQRVISWLCKNRKELEAFRVFNDLKERGYVPDRVMYTTMIHGLCSYGLIGEARRLWFEMIRKGYLPNEYTYSALIHGFCRIRGFGEARKLCKEMCEKGYGDTLVSCKTIIWLLRVEGKTSEAYQVFVEMAQKGIVPDFVIYNSLIQGFCDEGKIEESIDVLKELLAQGLPPSAASCSRLVKKLCQIRDMKGAKEMWDNMINWGLEPSIKTYDAFIRGHCAIGEMTEGMEWLAKMLKNRLKPETRTFETLLKSFLQRERLDDSLLIVDYIFRAGYILGRKELGFLVHKLCQGNSNFGKKYLGWILERN